MPSAMNSGGDSGIARRWRRERRIAANAPAAGRPRTADPPTATVASGSGQEETSAVGTGEVLMFRFHRDRCHARCTIPAIHDRLLSTAYCPCSLPHTTLEELSPG
jgi:hypothetical protein